MRSKVLILIVAVVLGTLAAFAGGQYLSRARARLEAGAEPVQVLVAQQDLPQGMTVDELIAKHYVLNRTVPRQYVSSGAVSSLSALDGQVLAIPVMKGELLTDAKFKTAAEVGLAYNVPQGMVAMSIKNSSVRGVSGMLKPGDHVAVIATFELSDGGIANAITKLILPNVRVVAVGGSQGATTQEGNTGTKSGGGIMTASASNGAGKDNPDEVAASTVTLALSPAEAEKVAFAEDEAKEVHLALLSSAETGLAGTKGVRMPLLQSPDTFDAKSNQVLK